MGLKVNNGVTKALQGWEYALNYLAPQWACSAFALGLALGGLVQGWWNTAAVFFFVAVSFVYMYKGKKFLEKGELG